MKSLTAKAIALLLVTLVLSSCGKDDDDNNNQSQAVATNPQPDAPSDGDGILVAIKTFVETEIPGNIDIPGAPSTVETEIQVATAAFFENQNSDNLLPAGDVFVNTDHQLDRQDNNSYTTPFDNPTSEIDYGFSSSNRVEWEVGGSSDVSAFSHTTSNTMPGEVDFSEDYGTVDLSGSFTLSIDAVSSRADSVIFLLADSDGNILMETKAGSSTSHTFADLSTLTTGTGVVQVTPFNIESETYNGKKYYFVNEVVITAYSDFQ